jgi:hypothetical protein
MGSGLGSNFNPVKSLSRRELAKVKRQAKEQAQRMQSVEGLVDAEQRKQIDERIKKIDEQIQKLRDRRSEMLAEAGYEDDDPVGQLNASQMLKEMWRVYRMKGGMKHLKAVVDSPGDFMELVKEIMKMEAAMARLGKNSAEDSAVFVIMRGLKDDPEVPAGAGKFDIEQIKNALDPEGGRQRSAVIAPEQAY